MKSPKTPKSPLIHKRDGSMLSTQMTKNQSAITGFFDSEMRKKAVLEYADQPMPKDVPRWNQSASTWRHTSHRYSFSQDQRFRTKKHYYSDLIEPQLPSTNLNKSCTFGKGHRAPISEVILRNAKEKPSPDAYKMDEFNEQTRSPKKGKTFGIGWNNYERAYIQHRQDVYSGHFTQKNPPADYQVRQIPGKHKRSFSTYARLKMFTSKMADVTRGNPGACHQIKDRHLQNTVGLNERNFGIGERINFSAPANKYPGAVYKIDGFTDKFQKTKKKNSPKKKLIV